MCCLLVKTLKNDCFRSISSKVFNHYNEGYSEFRSVHKELGLSKDSVFDGKEYWVYERNGIIQDGGVNEENFRFHQKGGKKK